MNSQTGRAALLISIIIVTATYVHSQGLEDPDRLAVDGYKTLPVLVEDIRDNPAHLTTDAVQNRVELRMRSAGLKPVAHASDGPTPPRFLSVTVNIVGGAFNVELRFYRYAFWGIAAGKSGEGMISSWDLDTTGTHSNSGAFILQALEGQMDRFLNAYLKANQE